MQIICLGDSITDCGHLLEDFPLGNGYVQILSDMFNKEVPSNIIQIKNYGFDGFTVARILDNIRQHRISLHRSPVVTLLIGINDIGLMMNTNRTPSQQEQMMKEFTVHYDELLKLLTADARQVSRSSSHIQKNTRHGFLMCVPCPPISSSLQKNINCHFCRYMIF